MNDTHNLECGCVVVGEHRQTPFLHIERFLNFCIRHVMEATLVSPKRHRRLFRRTRPEHSGRMYHLSGEPVSHEEWNIWFEPERLRLKEEYRRHLYEQEIERLEKEDFVIEAGWVCEGPDQWTAPEELRVRRTELYGLSPNRYVRTHLGHAYNTQRQEDRNHASTLQQRNPGELDHDRGSSPE